MKNRYPNPDELYALEKQARRMRAVEIARLLRAAFAAVAGAWKTRPSAKGLKHA